MEGPRTNLCREQKLGLARVKAEGEGDDGIRLAQFTPLGCELTSRSIARRSFFLFSFFFHLFACLFWRLQILPRLGPLCLGRFFSRVNADTRATPHPLV